MRLLLCVLLRSSILTDGWIIMLAVPIAESVM